MIKETDLVDKLTISVGSGYDLELELRHHPKYEAEVHRLYAQANKAVNDIHAQLEVVTAELIDEIVKEKEKSGKTVSFYTLSEIRKSIIPKDIRYRRIVAKLNKAIENKEYLYGLTKAWASRSHRLTELSHMMARSFYEGPRVYSEKDVDSASEKLEN